MSTTFKVTPVMIETALHEIEEKCGIATANMIRAYILSLKAKIDDDEAQEDE